MKNVLFLALTVASGLALADNYVNGYVRQDGTYVAPHYQTAPDSTRMNNYSTQGNVNPYNGNVGTQNPYRPPPMPTYQQPHNNPYANQAPPPRYGY
jgi:hypothetical protein